MTLKISEARVFQPAFPRGSSGATHKNLPFIFFAQKNVHAAPKTFPNGSVLFQIATISTGVDPVKLFGPP
jgi:hypothetical protein